MGSEKFCLRWNDFETNISSAFRELRDDKDFFDVTLACENEQIQAHKVILSACSPFFRDVLRRNPHAHPLLYLKSVKFTDIQSVLNFMYHGEVNVAQEELNSFLAVAEDLRVKGLTQNQSEPQNKHVPTTRPQPAMKIPNTKEITHPPPPKRPRPPISNTNATSSMSVEEDIVEYVPVKSEPREATAQLQHHTEEQSYPPAPSYPETPTQNYSTHAVSTQEMAFQEPESYEDFGQYSETGYVGETGGAEWEGNKGLDRSTLLKYLIQDSAGHGSHFQCSICGKANTQKNNVLKHIESIHFPDSFKYECNICMKTLKSKSALYLHNSRHHDNKM